MAKDEKKKRPAAHEAIIKMLTEATKKSIERYLFTFADMYALGTVAPAKAIPKLIEVLQKALGLVSEEAQSWMTNLLKMAIKELQDQLAEAKSRDNTMDVAIHGGKLVLESGLAFEVDPSDKALKKFGFKFGQRVIVLHSRKGLVIGVAPMVVQGMSVEMGIDVVWVKLEEEEGKFCFSSDPKNEFQLY